MVVGLKTIIFLQFLCISYAWRSLWPSSFTLGQRKTFSLARLYSSFSEKDFESIFLIPNLPAPYESVVGFIQTWSKEQESLGSAILAKVSFLPIVCCGEGFI
eukprot:scaffold1435_cov162-Ochromonas_danica.AAC.9